MKKPGMGRAVLRNAELDQVIDLVVSALLLL